MAGSILIYDCVDCCLALASQQARLSLYSSFIFIFISFIHSFSLQLRVHNALNSDFYLLTRSKPIIENCSGVRVAPYNFEYPELAAHLQTYFGEDAAAASGNSGGKQSSNLWCAVEDFNWPRTDEQSPNWSILSPEQRIAPVQPPPPSSSSSPPS